MGKKKSVICEGYREVKTAGFKQNKKASGVNRRAGLHDKKHNIEGETRVKRRKPLALKHVRRMRKAALALTAVFVTAVAGIVGVGFFVPSNDVTLDGEYETVCYETPTDGSAPTAHTLVENVGYMNYVLQAQPYWSSSMKSTVIPLGMDGMSQTVDNYKKYYNGVLISADLSISSLASLRYGEQFCQANGVIMSRYTTSTEKADLELGMDAPWSTEYSTGMTVKAFRRNRGLPPYDFSVYVLNELTIANAYDDTVTDNGDGTYTMTLNLNVNTGVDETSADYYYRLQMKVNGGLYELPTIKTTQVTYTFDASWRVLAFEINDCYLTPLLPGVATECTSSSVTTFSYEEASAKNTFWEDYFEAEYERLKDTLKDDDEYEAEYTEDAMSYLSGAFMSVMSDGAVFKIDLNLDDLTLNGVVAVEMKNSEFSGLSAKLGDILVWLDGNTLYINDGVTKYKANVGGLFSSDGEEQEGGFDLNELLNQMAGGEFNLNDETGVATLVSKVELFGFAINMQFEFKKSESGVELNFLKAQIPVGNSLVNASLCFGSESDKPALPQDISGYTDILNDGITVDLNVALGELVLDGFAKVIMSGGEFNGLYAVLGDFVIYYDTPANMLYFSDGNFNYKFNLTYFENSKTEGAEAIAALAEISGEEGLNISALLTEVLANISAVGGKISTAATLDLLGETLSATLGLQLSGGIKIDAGASVGNTHLSIGVALTDRTVKLPDFENYVDLFNSDITLDVSLTLDEVSIYGKLTLVFKEGEVTDIRADFGEIKLYYELENGALYLAVGETKIYICIENTDENSLDLGSLLDGAVSGNIGELLGNVTAGLRQIYVSANLDLLDSIVPVSATLDFDGGIGVRADIMLFGIRVAVSADLSKTAIPALGNEQKESYIDVLQNAWELAQTLIGERITATVSGSLYTDEERIKPVLDNNGNPVLDEKGNEVTKTVTGFEHKYNFSATVEYEKEPMYLHFNLALEAKEKGIESVYIDVYILDATPDTDNTGMTLGGYTTDGKLDLYLTVSRYAADNSAYYPLKMYAPIDEIATFAAMAGAMANLDKITFEDNEQLTSAVVKISDLVESMLIKKYLPATKDQFSSLGDSLLKQILGKSLGEFLGEVLTSVEEETGEVADREFKLSDNFVESFRYGNDSLELVLNSALVYNTDAIGAEYNVRAQLTKSTIEGVSYLSGIQLENIYFGDALNNRLNIGLTLGYGAVTKPASFAGYTNTTGVDTLVKAIINSASHATPDADAAYDLNHYYLLQGSVTATIDVSLLSINLINVDATIQFKSIAVYIDEETNDVSIDAHIYYDGVAKLGKVAIDGDADVYLSIKDGVIAIRRIRYSYYSGSSEKYYATPVEELRVMSLADFSANLMDNLVFIFNFGSVITDNISGAGGGDGVDFTDFDYGKSKDTVLSYYTGEKTEEGASWTFGINGGLIGALSGLETSDIPVQFKATLNEDGTYTVNTLKILSTTMKLWGSVVTLSLSGDITYCNPHEEMGEYTDTTQGNNLLVPLNFSLESEYDLGEDCAYENGVYERGSQFYLPIYTVINDNGKYFILDGYTVTGGNGVEVTVRKDKDGNEYAYFILADDAIVTANYSPLLYTITIIDGDSVTAITRDCGDTVNIEEFNTNTYLAQYFYDADGKYLTLPVDGDKTYYLYKVGKTFNVEYVSDLDYSGELDVFMQYGDDTDYLKLATRESDTMLGWFVKEGDSYKYIADVTALKDYVAQTNFADGMTVTLYAAWCCEFSVEVTTATRSFKVLYTEWKIGGTFTMAYASELSETILNNSDVKIETSVKYDQGSASETVDNLAGYAVFTGETFSSTNSCALLYDYGWATVKVSYKCGNFEISYSENSDCKKR